MNTVNQHYSPEDMLLFCRHCQPQLEAKYDSMMKMLMRSGFVFGITFDSVSFMETALATDAKDENEIAMKLVLSQYLYLGYKPKLIKSITVIDDERCLVVKKYGEAEPDIKRVAYVALDPQLLDICIYRDAKRPTLRVTDKSNRQSGFYASCPSGNMARKMGTSDFVQAYESFGGFFDGSVTMQNGFAMLLTPDIATYRRVIAEAMTDKKK